MSSEGWINEDELPEGYPYDEMFPWSKLGHDGQGGVRLFPAIPLWRCLGCGVDSMTRKESTSHDCGRRLFDTYYKG